MSKKITICNLLTSNCLYFSIPLLLINTYNKKKMFPVPLIYSAYICNRDWHRNTYAENIIKLKQFIQIRISQVSKVFKLRDQFEIFSDLKSWIDLMERNRCIYTFKIFYINKLKIENLVLKSCGIDFVTKRKTEACLYI